MKYDAELIAKILKADYVIDGHRVYPEEHVGTIFWAKPEIGTDRCPAAYATPGFEDGSGIDVCLVDRDSSVIVNWVIPWDGEGGVHAYMTRIMEAWPAIELILYSKMNR